LAPFVFLVLAVAGITRTPLSRSSYCTPVVSEALLSARTCRGHVALLRRLGTGTPCNCSGGHSHTIGRNPGRHLEALYRPICRRLSAKLVTNFMGRGLGVDHYGRQSRFSRPEPLIFHSDNSSVILTRLSEPRSWPTATQQIW
jgi:hypothetical protein